MRGGVGSRIEHQNRFAVGSGALFDGLHKRASDAVAAGAAVHEQLRDIGPVRLVLRPGPEDLDGAHDLFAKLSDEQFTTAREHVVARGMPETPGLGALEREHEADGRATLDAIDQHLRKGRDVRLDLGARQGSDIDCRASPAFNLSRPCSGPVEGGRTDVL